MFWMAKTLPDSRAAGCGCGKAMPAGYDEWEVAPDAERSAYMGGASNGVDYPSPSASAEATRVGGGMEEGEPLEEGRLRAAGATTRRRRRSTRRQSRKSKSRSHSRKSKSRSRSRKSKSRKSKSRSHSRKSRSSRSHTRRPWSKTRSGTVRRTGLIRSSNPIPRRSTRCGRGMTTREGFSYTKSNGTRVSVRPTCVPERGLPGKAVKSGVAAYKFKDVGRLTRHGYHEADSDTGRRRRAILAAVREKGALSILRHMGLLETRSRNRSANREGVVHLAADLKWLGCKEGYAGYCKGRALASVRRTSGLKSKSRSRSRSKTRKSRKSRSRSRSRSTRRRSHSRRR